MPTRHDPHVKWTKKAPVPVVQVIMPGRRSLGETWSKVTIGIDEETDSYVTTREDTAAPPAERPIIVPALGNLSVDMTNYLLEAARHNQRPLTQTETPAERWNRINKLWQDYAEQRLRHFKGQTTIGPAGMHQREGIRDGK